MNIEDFFKLFEEELRQNKALTNYHRFTNKESLYSFRKSYLEQRYNYVLKNISCLDDEKIILKIKEDYKKLKNF